MNIRNSKASAQNYTRIMLCERLLWVQDLVSLMQQALEILRGVVMSVGEDEEEEEHRLRVHINQQAWVMEDLQEYRMILLGRMDSKSKGNLSLFTLTSVSFCPAESCLSVDCLVSVSNKEASLA